MGSFAVALFRWALALFPTWFRRRYGRDMVHNFEVRLHAVGSERGFLPAVGFAVKSLAEVVPSALSLRLGDTDTGTARGTFGAPVDDLRLALKSLARAPGWTGAALLILTLGIGGTAAVFSVLNAVLLRPLPYADQDRLVALWTVNQVQNIPDGSSWENARDWVERSRGIEDIALMFRPEFTGATVTSFGEPERIHVGLVSPNFFEVIGIEAIAGRVFTPADLALDPRIAVIGEGLWHARYGADPDAIGGTVTIDGEEVRVVGVVSEGVALPRGETAVWQLFDVRTPEGENRRGWDAFVGIGKLAPGTTVDAAQAELDRVTAELALEHPETNRNRGVSVTPLHEEIVGERLPLLLWTLFASMVLVLLIGGTNVAQLMLSRGIERRRELAVRASLGATRSRVNRQLLIESLLLSALAGVGGITLAWVGLKGLIWMIPPGVPLTDGVRIDRMVLLLCFSLSAMVAPLVGLLPALSASRASVALVLRAGAGRGSTRRDQRARSVLVVAEVAMAVVLLVGAGLLVRSALVLQAVDPGFDARRTLVARVDLSPVGKGGDLVAVRERLHADVGHLPGVMGVGSLEQFFLERFPDQTITLVGDPPRSPGEPAPRLTTDWVLPGFFEAVAVPMLRGRPLRTADLGWDSGEAGSPPTVVVVNETWVDTFARGQDPVGLQFRWGDQVEGDAVTVVGVVGDLRRTTLDDVPYPQMFVAGTSLGFDLMVRASGDPLGVAPGVRDAVRRIDPQAAVSRVSSAWERYDTGMAPRNFQTLLFGIFAALATLLSAVGLFAILHDAVEARRREIAIRIALGAAPSGVRTMVLRQGLYLTGSGLGIGLIATIGLSSVLGRLVYGIESTDPATLGTVAVVLLAVAGLAGALPAYAATRVPPAETLASDH